MKDASKVGGRDRIDMNLAKMLFHITQVSQPLKFLLVAIEGEGGGSVCKICNFAVDLMACTQKPHERAISLAYHELE